MRLATVDVGTNTVRGLLAEQNGDGFSPLLHLQTITRLGGGFSPEAGLSQAAIQRTENALVELIGTLKASGPERIRAVATQAMRQAGNRDLLIDGVEARTGVRIEVISGEEEAQLSAAGILAALRPVADKVFFFDIGGGSTEIGLIQEGKLHYFRSFPIGVVRLQEDCPDDTARNRWMQKVLETLKTDLLETRTLPLFQEDGLLAVGTAGTATTLGALELEMSEYDWRRINNLQLSRDVLLGWRKRLAALSLEERGALPGLEPGRADLILPGLDWTMALIGFAGTPCLTISDFGLLEGALLALAKGR